MTTRILPREEWPRLVGTEAEALLPTLDPEKAAIVVVEDDGAIVGCHVLFTMLHAECLWIHPEHRGRASAARRLWAAVQDEARAIGATALITGAANDRVRGLLAHVGATPLPVDQYVVPIQPAQTPEEAADRRRGASFHRQLETQLAHENHPDDVRHDVAVGRALRVGIAEGRVDDAVRSYNAWAVAAGYVPIRHLDTRDGPRGCEWVIDMDTAVIAIDQDYGVTVLDERRVPCRS